MFVPMGYLYKKIVKKPDWINASIEDVYSISDCVSENFAEYIDYWSHNDYWIFNSPEIMQKIAADKNIDLSEMQLFYYEIYKLQYTDKWQIFAPSSSLITNVLIPKNKQLKGFDVATFSQGNLPECSPLSCNNLADEKIVNSHCLFDTFEEAKQAIELNFFDKGEPGPHRIIAIYQV